MKRWDAMIKRDLYHMIRILLYQNIGEGEGVSEAKSSNHWSRLC